MLVVLKKHDFHDLCIHYLLCFKEYLQSVIVDLESKLENSSKEQEGLLKRIDELDTDITKLKQENKNRRKMIKQQQMLIDSGASSYYQVSHSVLKLWKVFSENCNFIIVYVYRQVGTIRSGCASLFHFIILFILLQWNKEMIMDGVFNYYKAFSEIHEKCW